LRKKIKYVDLQKVEQAKEDLNDLEIETRSNISHDPREAIYNSIDIEEALKTLSKKQRECFELVVEDGHTERDAAKILGIAKTSLHVHLERAKEKIKIFLKGVDQNP